MIQANKIPKTETLWCCSVVMFRTRYFLQYTFALTRKDSIKECENVTGYKWSELKKDGYMCTKAWVQPAKN